MAAYTGRVGLATGFVQIHTDVWLVDARTATRARRSMTRRSSPVALRRPGRRRQGRFEETFTTFETGIDPWLT